MALPRRLIESWEELEDRVKKCIMCPLHKNRKNAVLGEGPKNSPVMFIGEAPGAVEDEMGRPFVGAAGRLLTLTLESAGIRREEVYITNVVKCRPPQNREPHDEEVERCNIYLESQIWLLKPKIIVTLGNIAGKKIFSMGSRQWEGVMKMRGKAYRMDILGLQVIVVPTIHPAAALYNPPLREIFANDLRLVKSLLESESLSAKRVSTGVEKGAKTLIDYIKKS